MRYLKFMLLFLLIPTLCFGGVDFNGDADYINLGTVSSCSDFQSGFSLFVIVKTTQTIPFGVFGDYDGDDTGIFVSLNEQADGTDTAGRIRVFIDDNGSALVNGRCQFGVNTDTGINDGDFHSLFISVNTSCSAVITIDGGSAETITYPDATLDWSYLSDCSINSYIGSANSDGTPVFIADGIIDELYVWHTNLTQAQGDILHNSKIKRMGLQIEPSNLKAYLPLDDYGDGVALNTDADGYKDLSGNANHGQGVDTDGDSDNVAETVLSYP